MTTKAAVAEAAQSKAAAETAAAERADFDSLGTVLAASAQQTQQAAAQAQTLADRAERERESLESSASDLARVIRNPKRERGNTLDCLAHASGYLAR